MNGRVFISYSRRDGLTVLSYVNALREKGIHTWIDQTGIGGASEWSAEIVNAIGTAELVIVMFSRSSVESRNVAREVSLAAEEGKRLLPVFLEKTSIPSSFRYHLAGIQRIEAAGKDVDTVTNEIIRAIEALPSLEAPPANVASPSIETPAPAASPAKAPASWEPELLAKVEGKLALSLGPIAKVLVRKTARAESEWDPFTHSLSEQIPTPEEKADFLDFCRTLSP